MLNIKYLDLPGTIKAVSTKNEDDSYTVILNSKLNYEQNVSSYNHEISHIDNNDFVKECVNDIECQAHEIFKKGV